ncbi:MAG: hypothetical protein DRQ51_04535 [Gammaproteobacteria bacterium]|nr:MAG: hypothetical protein DRQ51_04535 [Gammaproteobacteria bacterium]
MLKRNLGEKYSPLYFLSALGAGGLSVSFFVYLTFMVPHQGTPIISFKHLMIFFNNNSMALNILVITVLTIIAVLALLHLFLLWWNISELNQFKTTKAYEILHSSNTEITMMAIPLTLAMTINVMFAVGSLFVPGLWTVVEYLFPVAILSFLAVGLYGLKLFLKYLQRLMLNGDFDLSNNNNLSQMLSIFAFSMVAVGLAAPGAMSHIKIVNAIAMFGSIFFLSVAILFGIMKLVLGFRAILSHGLAEATSPSIWMIIPILTLIGITLVRLKFGMNHGLGAQVQMPDFFVLTSVILSIQLLFGFMGYSVLKKLGYFKDYLNGNKANAGSYALVCPGVAFNVFGQFFIFFGLVKNNILPIDSIAFYMFLTPFVVVQFFTIKTLFKLNNKLIFTK